MRTSRNRLTWLYLVTISLSCSLLCLAAKFLIGHWSCNYKLGTILVVLQPERIEGKKGKKQFYNFVPPKT
jgi:hypothetical protein